MANSLPFSSRPPVAMAPWTTAEIAEGLHRGWTTGAANIADAERLMAVLRAEAPDAKSVLDYGCGTGRLSVYVPAGYVGYDPSAAMLAVARREYPAARFVDCLPPGERFDVVVANSVVQYQRNHAWADVLRDIATRAKRVALIETYDAARSCDGLVTTAGGSDSYIVCRAAQEYLAALGEFGAVERRVLAHGDHPTTHDLALYIVRVRRAR